MLRKFDSAWKEMNQLLSSQIKKQATQNYETKDTKNIVAYLVEGKFSSREKKPGR